MIQLSLIASIFFAAVCEASDTDANTTNKSTGGHLSNSVIIISIALAALLISTGVGVLYCLRKRQPDQMEDTYSIDISGSIDEAFPDMKPAFGRLSSEISTMSQCSNRLTPRLSASAPSPSGSAAQTITMRQGSMAILEEINDGFPIDLTEGDAEDLCWDEYGNQRVRTHSVMFDTENDSLDYRHNRNDLEFAEED